MKNKKSMASLREGYKYTFLDKLVYLLCLKRTQFIMALILLFDLNYTTNHIIIKEENFASVPNIIWNTLALYVLIFYELYIGSAFLGLFNTSKNLHNDFERLSKDDYQIRIKPKIYYADVWKKLFAIVFFILTSYLILFSGIARTDFTSEKIEKYNILGQKTASYDYSEIEFCEINCTSKRRSVSGVLVMSFVLPNKEEVDLELISLTNTYLNTALEIKSKLTDAKITYNEYLTIEEHIEWFEDYTEEEISMVYELFDRNNPSVKIKDFATSP